jgi:ariadne-1
MIEGVREVLSLSSSAAAAALLRHFKWNQERLLEAYMANPEKTLKEIGMGSLVLEVPPPPRPINFSCSVCLEEVAMADTFALGCGHRYCNNCWADYLEVHVMSGANCVYTQCMSPGCTELCHEECFQKRVAPKVFERYKEFLHRSFIDHNPNVKWCPRPGCDNAVSCDRRGRRQPVLCACGFLFCFQCADYEIGNHLPASCASVKTWMEKGKDESENVKWMMANCKVKKLDVLFLFFDSDFCRDARNAKSILRKMEVFSWTEKKKEC